MEEVKQGEQNQQNQQQPQQQTQDQAINQNKQETIQAAGQDIFKRDLFGEALYYPFVIDNTFRRIRPIPSMENFLKLFKNFYISGVLKADITQTTIIGTDQNKTLNSFLIPANTISRNDPNNDLAGNVFRITANGLYTTDDNFSVCNLSFKVGSTTFHEMGNGSGIATNNPWKAEWLIITKGNTWSSFLTFHTKVGSYQGFFESYTSQTIDISQDQTISIVASWAGGSAGDSLKINQFLVELLN